MLSHCFSDCSVGVGFFVTGLSQISSFSSFYQNLVEFIISLNSTTRSLGDKVTSLCNVWSI